jgi:hypothetical protein
MEEHLRLLLERLASIGNQHVELYDSEVRERMGEAIMDGFVRQEPDYVVKQDFGMATVAGNLEVRSTLVDYIGAANETAKALGITRFHDRLGALQNTATRTARLKHDYESFFGHTPPEFYDENGVVTRLQ